MHLSNHKETGTLLVAAIIAAPWNLLALLQHSEQIQRSRFLLARFCIKIAQRKLVQGDRMKAMLSYFPGAAFSHRLVKTVTCETILIPFCPEAI